MATHSDPRQYVKLAARLREQIQSGKLVPGKPVPSITVLCRQYQTSRRTAGKAMQVLEKESLLLRVPGLGYFVRDAADAPATDAPATDNAEGTIPDQHDGAQPETTPTQTPDPAPVNERATTETAL